MFSIVYSGTYVRMTTFYSIPYCILYTCVKHKYNFRQTIGSVHLDESAETIVRVAQDTTNPHVCILWSFLNVRSAKKCRNNKRRVVVGDAGENRTPTAQVWNGLGRENLHNDRAVFFVSDKILFARGDVTTYIAVPYDASRSYVIRLISRSGVSRLYYVYSPNRNRIQCEMRLVLIDIYVRARLCIHAVGGRRFSCVRDSRRNG